MSEGFPKLSDELSNREKALVVVETFLYSLIILVSIIGNFSVLQAIYRNSQLRTIPNYFIAALALSDILLPLVTSPQTIAVIAVGRWPFNHNVCQAQGYFVIVFACTSLLILTLTAINRFYRIVRTKHYRRIFTKGKTVTMIGLCFILACLEPIPYFSFEKRYVFQPGKMFCFQTTEITVPNLLVYLYVGVPVVTLSYFCVFKKLRLHRQTVQNNIQSASLSTMATQRDIKITKILFITVIAFLACWTPILIIDFVDTFQGDVAFPREIYVLYLYLGNLSGAINPVIYGVLNKNFREEYIKLFSCAKRRRRRIKSIQEVSERRSTVLFTRSNKHPRGR